MPKVKSAVSRYHIIDICLNNKFKPFPSLEDLAEECSKKIREGISTSTIEKDRFGSIGSLAARILSINETDDPKFLSSGAPSTKTGFIVVNTISGASFLIKPQAADSANVFDLVYV